MQTLIDKKDGQECRKEPTGCKVIALPPSKYEDFLKMRIKTSLEQYVEQHGMMGTFRLLKDRITKETDPHKREFFLTCEDLLTTDRGGLLLDAARRFHDNK